VRKLLLKILPQSIIDFYKNNKKQYKLKQREALLQNKQIVTEQEIIHQLHQVGIKQGDIIMLHSSLSKIGYVDGGADTVINSLLNVIAEDGTLMMPAFPAVGYNYDYLNTNPVFDVKHTASKMGIITENFRKRNGVLRSLHPTDSVCALGKQASYLTEGHFDQLTPYNSHSPFYRLYELKGKIVLIGVDLNSLTNLHTLEDAVDDFKYPVYHSHLFNCKLINEKGECLVMQTKAHNPVYSKKRKCNELILHFEKAGFLKRFKVGLADCLLIDAQHLHLWMVKNYIDFGITMYTPNGN
jgi:aminoglycoside 3-N-acetyltransferase